MTAKEVDTAVLTSVHKTPNPSQCDTLVADDAEWSLGLWV